MHTISYVCDCKGFTPVVIVRTYIVFGLHRDEAYKVLEKKFNGTYSSPEEEEKEETNTEQKYKCALRYVLYHVVNVSLFNPGLVLSGMTTYRYCSFCSQR